MTVLPKSAAPRQSESPATKPRTFARWKIAESSTKTSPATIRVGHSYRLLYYLQELGPQNPVTELLNPKP